MIVIDMDQKVVDSKNTNGDEDNCIFHLFYQKINKYFGDIVYTLDRNADTTLNNQTSSNKVNSNQEQVEIITTIVNDLTHNKDSKIDFKLSSKNTSSSSLMDENGTNQGGLAHSKSQNDLQYEFLQSQTDPAATKTDANSSRNINTTNTVEDLNDAAQTSPPIAMNNFAPTQNTHDILIKNMVKSLQSRFMAEFLFFLNHAFIGQTIEDRFFNVETCTLLLSNQLQCACYKDMLNSFLILIDYQFTEKFLYEFGNFKFVDYFKGIGPSRVSFISHPERFDEICDSFDMLKIDKDYLSINFGWQDDQLNEAKYLTERNSSRFMYLPFINCLNTLWYYMSHTSLPPFRSDPNMNPNKVKIAKHRYELIEQRLKLNETLLKDDYRIKNLLCIYKVADISFVGEIENALGRNSDSENDGKSQKACDKPTYNPYAKQYAHIKSNLVSLNSQLRSFTDDFFDFD